MLKLPDARLKILVQGKSKARIQEYLQERPSFQVGRGGARGRRSPKFPRGRGPDAQCPGDVGKDSHLEGHHVPGPAGHPGVHREPGRLADLVAANLRLKIEESQAVLEETDPSAASSRSTSCWARKWKSPPLAKIQSQAREEMDPRRREYFLRERLRAIRRNWATSTIPARRWRTTG